MSDDSPNSLLRDEMGCSMNEVLSTGTQKIESYAVDVDGLRKLEHGTFAQAVAVALELRQTFPTSKISVCDASAPTSHGEITPVAA